MQPSWKFYLGGIILTLHNICNYMSTFEGTPRPTDSKISFISKSSYQIICKWCQRNYRSHLRPQGKTPFLQYRAMALPLPKCCQHDTQPEPTRGHTQRRRHPQGTAALCTTCKGGRLGRKLRVRGGGKTEREQHTTRGWLRPDPPAKPTPTRHMLSWTWHKRLCPMAPPDPQLPHSRRQGGISKVLGPPTLGGHFSRAGAAEGWGCRGSAPGHLHVALLNVQI